MGKRSNEHGQMRKEDYEEMERRRGGGGGVTHGFEHADPSTLRRRKMVRAHRPAGARDTGATTASDAPPKANAFAALMGIAAAKTSPASVTTTTTTGGFSFKTSTATSTTAAPAAAPSSGDAFSFSKSTASDTSKPAASARRAMNKFEEYAGSLDESLESCINTLPPEQMGSNLEGILHKYLKYQVAQLKEWSEANPEQAKQKADHNSKAAADAAKKSAGAPDPTPAPTSAPVVESQPKFPFGISKTDTSASAPAAGVFSFTAAPASFKFGTSSPSSPAPAPTTTGGFFFGSSTTSSTQPVASSFKFGDGSTSTWGAVEASTAAANEAVTPTPGFAFGGGGQAKVAEDDEDGVIPPEDGETQVQEVEDEGWKDMHTLEPVHLYRRKDLKGTDKSMTKFVSGKLRVQRASNNPKDIRMVMRDEKGMRVLLNCTIKPDLKLHANVVGRAGKPNVGTISMGLLNDEKRGMELHVAKCPLDVHHKLVAALQDAIEQASA